MLGALLLLESYLKYTMTVNSVKSVNHYTELNPLYRTWPVTPVLVEMVDLHF